MRALIHLFLNDLSSFVCFLHYVLIRFKAAFSCFSLVPTHIVRRGIGASLLYLHGSPWVATPGDRLTGGMFRRNPGPIPSTSIPLITLALTPAFLLLPALPLQVPYYLRILWEEKPQRLHSNSHVLLELATFPLSPL